MAIRVPHECSDVCLCLCVSRHSLIRQTTFSLALTARAVINRDITGATARPSALLISSIWTKSQDESPWAQASSR